MRELRCSDILRRCNYRDRRWMRIPGLQALASSRGRPARTKKCLSHISFIGSVPNSEVRMENKISPASSGMEPVLAELQQHLQTHPMEWLKTLRQDPAGLAKLKVEIHQAFDHMAEKVIAGLVSAMNDAPGGTMKK
jgi:hypothetical protein